MLIRAPIIEPEIKSRRSSLKRFWWWSEEVDEDEDSEVVEEEVDDDDDREGRWTLSSSRKLKKRMFEGPLRRRMALMPR